MSALDALIPEFDVLRRRFPPGADSSMVLPCLHRIQIEEVLAHYTMFRRRPIGRWHLEVCRNLSCTMRGAEGLIGQLEQRLGITTGQTTPDGQFTLSTAECLGSCGTAPVVVVNGAYRENISPERLDALLAELRATPREEPLL